MIATLALKSLRNRKGSVALTVLSIALSVLLLLGVERVRSEARESFTATVSGTDLIVGARTSPVHLLLYSVFNVGYANNNLSGSTYRDLAARPEVAWTIPLSMGDTHRGFRVVGTTADFFRHFRFGQGKSLRLEQGVFDGRDNAVLGADVARQLGYRIGDRIVLAHGAGDVSFIQHDAHPFRVGGVLARTGTPVDRAVYVDLAAIADIHEAPAIAPMDPLRAAMGAAREPHPIHAEIPAGDEHAGHEDHAGHAAPRRHDESPSVDGGDHPSSPEESARDPSPVTITAVLIGLKSRAAALGVQRALNDYSGEPLTAILPGPTLQEVWEVVGTLESTLFAVSALVVMVGLAGMLVALLTSLNERRREMAILRSVGARPAHVFALILGEAGVITLTGIALGVLALHAGLWLLGPLLEARAGLYMPLRWLSLYEFTLIAAVAAAGLLIGLLPAYRSYRHTLADGMLVRV